MTKCPSCRAELRTPLVCEACSELQDPVDGLSPFAVFGLEPAYALDAGALRRRLLELSRTMHPDFYATAGLEARAQAERNTAALNAAYDVLADDERRAAWLLQELGGPDESQERQMPQAFLMEVLEWNEAIDEARAAAPDSSERAALESLAAALTEKRAEVLAAVGEALTPLPAPGSSPLPSIRRRLNAARYLDRALGEIRELRLARPSRER